MIHSSKHLKLSLEELLFPLYELSISSDDIPIHKHLIHDKYAEKRKYPTISEYKLIILCGKLKLQQRFTDKINGIKPN